MNPWDNPIARRMREDPAYAKAREDAAQRTRELIGVKQKELTGCDDPERAQWIRLDIERLETDVTNFEIQEVFGE